MAHTVITVGREYGSGGRLIAQKAAEALGIPFFDRSIINMAAEETGLSADFIRRTEQQKTSSFLYNLYMSTQSLPVNDQVFIAQSEVIRRVAAEGPCIIVGRCADYVLRNQSDVDALNLFIHAPMEERIRRSGRSTRSRPPTCGSTFSSRTRTGPPTTSTLPTDSGARPRITIWPSAAVWVWRPSCAS